MDTELHRIAHPKKTAFLRAYAHSGNIVRASALAGVARRSHYNWIEEDPEYAEAFTDAQAEAIENLVGEARRRAVEGVRRLVFYQGQPIIDPEASKPYVEYAYSDTLLIFLLKSLLPEKYDIRSRASSKE